MWDFGSFIHGSLFGLFPGDLPGDLLKIAFARFHCQSMQGPDPLPVPSQSVCSLPTHPCLPKALIVYLTTSGTYITTAPADQMASH